MKHVSKIYGSLLAIVMAWLGFACNKNSSSDIDIRDIRLEYGTPWVMFKVKGAVISQENDVPIEGIRAVLKIKYDAEGQFVQGMDTVYTDDKGAFNLKGRGGNKLYIEFIDVDGEKNGSFADKEIEVDYSGETVTATDDYGHLCIGEAEKDLGTVKMEPKE